MANLRHKYSQSLASGSVNFVKSWNYDVIVDCILVHSSSPITESIEVSFDSSDGDAYDTVLDRKDMISNSDYVYRPVRPQLFKKGDACKVAITNANMIGTIGITVMAKISQEDM